MPSSSTSEPEETKTVTPTPKRTGVQLFNAKVVAADLATACFVGATVAIPISIIDFAIMAKVAGVVPTMGHQVKAGFRQLFTRPKNFFFVDTPTTSYAFVYRLVVGVYVGTYIVANVSRSFFEGYQNSNPTATAYNCGVSSSAVNVALTIWKDSNILKVMPSPAAAGGAAVAAGAAAAATSKASEKVFIPMLSRVGFALRDTLTCVAAFTVVPLLKEYLKEKQGMSDFGAQTAASLLTPCTVQLLSTNIHVPAIKYQRMYSKDRRWGGPEGYLAGMGQALKQDYIGALRLRVLRIFFAFGLGTIMNSEVRPAVIRTFEPKAFG